MAAACPRCAHPIAATAPPPRPQHEGAAESRRAVTIEQTSKKHKAGQALGVLIIFLGIGACTAGVGVGSAALLALGVAVYVVAKAGAWWSNG